MRPKKQQIIFLLSCLSLCWLFSCTSGEMEVEQPEKEMTTLQLSLTRSGDEDPETAVGKVRLVVLNRSGRCLLNTTTPQADGVTFEEIVPAGYLQILLFANEVNSWNLDSWQEGQTVSESDIKAKQLNFTGYPTVDENNLIPMFGRYEVIAEANKLTEISGTTHPLGTVERLYAKVTLNIKCDYSASSLAGTKVLLNKVTVCHMPGISYLMASPYEGSGFITEGAAIVPNNTSHGYDPDNSGFEAQGITFYIPEHILNSRDKYTYLTVYAYQADNTSNTRKYTLVIGNGMAGKTVEWMKGDGPTLADLAVTRNTHYQFNATITGFNQSLTVNAKVVTWETINIPAEYPTYFLSVSRSSLNLAVGETGSVYVNTDYGSWTAEIETGSDITITNGSASGPGYFTITVNNAITTANVIKVTAGNMTKKIIVEN
ncbi:hypothetical protein M2459_003328 [Parabacteroides sp. PF5-5]|uniref:hypothetical protein n=1 Tax=unclassified Parabacteroides TaxID=2649774 RepID=UPI0024771CE1|nr:MULTISPECIES: hypothetical protein [unclassified Parabacteroides]MDH6306603.1 hypothetical protein [Parabacteroides sp. PH5-39]MDH6317570.1 hypothetical protein [Parabacteroides sp. PF5-13]MDH6321314.1 hypothetical protein [Parabacteroides sp. PH5-13]MDH6325046.1 hypothetical protein [Parabacteroides sp. PH5-8]MDH6328755.1 hypothetical protein [Parabacteroides sp. PH5-41]